MDPNSQSFPTPQAEVQIQREQVNDQIPDPSDHQGTLRYWDEYRRKERARIAAMGVSIEYNLDEVTFDANGDAHIKDFRIESKRPAGRLSHPALVIGEMPSSDLITRISDREKARKAQLEIAAAERATKEEARRIEEGRPLNRLRRLGKQLLNRIVPRVSR